MKSLTEWLSYLESLHPSNIDLGLDRIRQVATPLQLTNFPCPVITVAGTNGKGSTVALLENMYLQAGYKVATLTSPHFLNYNERIRINGQDINDASLCEAFTVIETSRGDISLTYFEFGVLAALHIFQQSSALDIIILEVGLGGRLDAVNIVESDVAVVTSIGLDHMNWLGNDREAIGKEKAGIFRRGKPAVCGDPQPPESLKRYAQDIKAELYCQGRDFAYQCQAQSWCWNDMQDLPLPKLAMQNASTALMTMSLLSLPIPESVIRSVLSSTSLTGRFQVIPGRITRIFDVAHNPQSAEYLAQQLTEFSDKKIYAVFSQLTDKDISATIKPVAQLIQQWYIADLAVPRAASVQQLTQALAQHDIQTVTQSPSIVDAYQTARDKAKPGDVILVFGSFYTVAGILDDNSSPSSRGLTAGSSA